MFAVDDIDGVIARLDNHDLRSSAKWAAHASLRSYPALAMLELHDAGD